MSENDEIQRTPGRRQPCCISMRWAVFLNYVKRGYLLHMEGKPAWIPWTMYLKGDGWAETSPIHFCPFCGKCLDAPEDS